MAPDTELSVQRLRRFFTAWDYGPKAMIWDGRFVSIQPIPVRTSPPLARQIVGARPWTPITLQPVLAHAYL